MSTTPLDESERGGASAPVQPRRHQALSWWLLMLLAGGVVLIVHTLLLRNALHERLAHQQRVAAQALLVLEPGAPAALLASAAGTAGALQRVVWRDAAGAVLAEHRWPVAPADVPAWFAGMDPVSALPARARVASDAAVPGRTVEVVLSPSSAHESLWVSSSWLAALLSVLGVAFAGAVTLGQRRLDARLRSAAQLAEATLRAERSDIPAPSVPELRRMTDAVATAMSRLQDATQAQVAQVEALQRQAHTDAVTGLPNRRHFIGRLQETLAEAAVPGGALLIVRILDLQALNERLGHDAADRALAAVGDLLQTYPQRVAGAFAGRLNGRDFGLYLPASGLAEETAASLLGALRASPAVTLGAAEAVVGGVDGLSGSTGEGAGPVLAAADAALAHAEAAGAFALQIHMASDHGGEPAGARAWRERIAEALALGRTQLGDYPVQDARGQLLHLDCPMRVQFEAGGPFRAASRWLALAARSRLLPQVDLAAVVLALQATSRDGLPRCVHVASASLLASGFIDDVRRQLVQQPEAARLLCIDVAEAALPSMGPEWRSAATAWGRHGARLGIEHAGAGLSGLAQLASHGLDHIRIDARFVRGVAADPSLRDFARSLVIFVHGIGLTVVAQGIDDEDDLAVLWELGFDGATGPAVRGHPLR